MAIGPSLCTSIVLVSLARPSSSSCGDLFLVWPPPSASSSNPRVRSPRPPRQPPPAPTNPPDPHPAESARGQPTAAAVILTEPRQALERSVITTYLVYDLGAGLEVGANWRRSRWRERSPREQFLRTTNTEAIKNQKRLWTCGLKSTPRRRYRAHLFAQ